MKTDYIYNARVTRVVDGDTFDATVDLGFKVSTIQRFRLEGVDTPETWRPMSEAEYQHGLKATALVESLIQGKTITIKTFKEMGPYNRYSAIVTLSDGRDLAQILIEAGMSKLPSYEPGWPTA